jgi:transcriptional regulator with XRE-family HTH domain
MQLQVFSYQARRDAVRADQVQRRMIKKSEGRSPIDLFVGSRIRERRTMLGLTQGQFGDMIGVTCQQILKYERGTNRVSAGRLYVIARELGVPLESFFEGLEQNDGQPPKRGYRLLDIMRNIGEIKSEDRLEALGKVVRALAGG